MLADVFTEDFSNSFVSLPNYISPVLYVKACIGLQPQTMSKLSFSLHDTHHTHTHEGPDVGQARTYVTSAMQWGSSVLAPGEIKLAEGSAELAGTPLC